MTDTDEGDYGMETVQYAILSPALYHCIIFLTMERMEEVSFGWIVEWVGMVG